MRLTSKNVQYRKEWTIPEGWKCGKKTALDEKDVVKKCFENKG